jgi:transposase
MELLGKVRRMFYRDKLSRSEISRRTGLSRNTIKKWLDAAEGAAPKYRRESTPGKLTPFHAFLLQALEADAHRPKRDRRQRNIFSVKISRRFHRDGSLSLSG